VKMWDEYCRKFRGGICEKMAEEHGKPLYVPRQWCIHVCRGNWDGKTLNKKGLGRKRIEPQELNKRNYVRDRHELKIYRGNLLANEKAVRRVLTTVIITATEEKQLNNTIENLLSTASGEIEIIVVLDGYNYGVVENPKVKVLQNEEPIGRRACLNKAAVVAEGKFLFFCPAHCRMSSAWDLKLKTIANPVNIGAAVLRSQKESDEAKEIVFYVLDNKLNACKRRAALPKKHRPLIAQSLCFADGDAWMISKKRWDALGGADLSLGKSGNEGLEWSMKAQLQHKEHPGKIYIHSSVTCRHFFKSTLAYRLYTPKSISPKVARKKLINLFSQKSVSRLIKEYFMPEEFRPMKKTEPVLTIEQIVLGYETAKAKMKKLNRLDEMVDQNEYIRRRMACKICNGGYKCPDFCCGLPTKLGRKKFECKRGKL